MPPLNPRYSMRAVVHLLGRCVGLGVAQILAPVRPQEATGAVLEILRVPYTSHPGFHPHPRSTVSRASGDPLLEELSTWMAKRRGNSRDSEDSREYSRVVSCAPYCCGCGREEAVLGGGMEMSGDQKEVDQFHEKVGG